MANDKRGNIQEGAPVPQLIKRGAPIPTLITKPPKNTDTAGNNGKSDNITKNTENK